jgi:hypothetical protein
VGRRRESGHDACARGLLGGGGAADVPVFVLWIGADDEEVVGGGDAAVTGAGG